MAKLGIELSDDLPTPNQVPGWLDQREPHLRPGLWPVENPWENDGFDGQSSTQQTAWILGVPALVHSIPMYTL